MELNFRIIALEGIGPVAEFWYPFGEPFRLNKESLLIRIKNTEAENRDASTEYHALADLDNALAASNITLPKGGS